MSATIFPCQASSRRNTGLLAVALEAAHTWFQGSGR